MKQSDVKECTERCAVCMNHDMTFTFSDGYEVTCGYLLRHGKARGCPAGDDCTRFEDQ